MRVVTLLGTSHVSPKSIQEVQEKVSEYDIIAVELDKARVQSLFSNQKKQTSFFQLVKQVGFSGAIFAKIGHYVEHKIGARIGTTPGDEMKQAIIQAAEHNKQVALIDQPIHRTLQRFSTSFTWRVKLKLLKTAFKRTHIQFDVTGTPDEKTIQQLIEYVDIHIPELAQVLIHERNTYMARQLKALHKKYPEKTILAVVGAGHLPGLREELNRLMEEKQL